MKDFLVAIGFLTIFAGPVFAALHILPANAPLFDRETGQFPRPQKDLCEHGAVQAARVGIAQRWMVRRQQMQPVRKNIVSSV